LWKRADGGVRPVACAIALMKQTSLRRTREALPELRPPEAG
jgi:hypothetical protein